MMNNITWNTLRLLWEEKTEGYYHITTSGEDDNRIYIGISTKPIDDYHELVLFPNSTSVLFDGRTGNLNEFIVEYIKENLMEEFTE